jgi:uracil-DNA glycosylase
MQDELKDIVAGLKSYVEIEKAFGFDECIFSVQGQRPGRAKLMFVDEAPGKAEDLLTKIIEAMGLKRENVYIVNNLYGDNVAKQVESISPKIIVTLGELASRALLRTEAPISALRGKFHDYNGIKVMPTLHPEYLLRNPDEKKTVWGDMKRVMKELGISNP